jgi:hypothetical protein
MYLDLTPLRAVKAALFISTRCDHLAQRDGAVTYDRLCWADFYKTELIKPLHF